MKEGTSPEGPKARESRGEPRVERVRGSGPCRGVIERPGGSRHDTPPDLDDDGELQYEVEEVLDSRRNKRRRNLLEYKVHWKGYPREDDSWLPHSELQDTAPELLQEFHDRYPKKPRPL